MDHRHMSILNKRWPKRPLLDQLRIGCSRNILPSLPVVRMQAAIFFINAGSNGEDSQFDVGACVQLKLSLRYGYILISVSETNMSMRNPIVLDGLESINVESLFQERYI